MSTRLPFIIVHPVNHDHSTLVNLAHVQVVHPVSNLAGGGTELVLGDHSLWCKDSFDTVLSAIRNLECD